MRELEDAYVLPGRRYRRLRALGSLRRLSDEERAQFIRSLAHDARTIDDSALSALLDAGWRPRLTAAWLIGLDRRERFRERLAALLVQSRMPYAGEGYCAALLLFGTVRDAEILADYLRVWLPGADRPYDQGAAIGALLVLSEVHGRPWADEFLAVWSSSVVRHVDPSMMRRLAARQREFARVAMSA